MQKGTYIRMQDIIDKSRYIEMFFPLLEPEDLLEKQRLKSLEISELVTSAHHKSRHRSSKYGDDALRSFYDTKTKNLKEYIQKIRDKDYLLIIQKIDCPN